MGRIFNTDGYCDPKYNYMVDLSGRLEKIKRMIDEEKYFTVNKARQYGKTTILNALADDLREEYCVLSLDFQGISNADFESEQSFAAAFSRQILMCAENIPEDNIPGDNIPGDVKEELTVYATGTVKEVTLSVLFMTLSKLCVQAEKRIVLIIDEVDSAANNQVFIDFLAQLRFYYLKRRKRRTFQSVILAGVYDIRNIRRKIRSDEEHRQNSPWNIAADFDVNMSFSAEDIAGMLREYEEDYHTGMAIEEISRLVYDYTSGYPFLVSRLCKVMDEKIAGSEAFPDKRSVWTREGFLEAEKLVVKENNTLYQSLTDKLNSYPQLRTVLYELLFTGKPIPYTATNDYIQVAEMFGFIRNEKEMAVISNRIFEMVLYNFFISEEFALNMMYKAGVQERNQFIIGGHLDVRKILEKFVETFDYLYGGQDDTFLEETGRRYFLLFLKPIINGVGNYSIEPETRNSERMDLVIYYGGEQYICELKIWRGNAYNERGEEQLSAYLDYFHLKKGYMLSFNFNKKKEIGVKEIVVGDKVLIEAVV